MSNGPQETPVLTDGPSEVPLRVPVSGLWTAAVMLTAWVAFVIVISTVLILGLLTFGWSWSDISALKVPPGVLVAMTLYQFLAMIGLSVLTARWVVRRTKEAPTAGMRAILALWPAAPIVLILAALTGVTVGWLPGWAAEFLSREYPWLRLGSVDLVGDMLTEGPLATRLLMIVTVTLLGPVAEELMFRGVLFDAMSRVGGLFFAVVTTTLLFSAVHLDPAQAIPLLITGAFLGWVRATTGSVWPAVTAHVVNNTLAVSLALLGIAEAAVSLPLAMAATCIAAVAVLGTRIAIPVGGTVPG